MEKPKEKTPSKYSPAANARAKARWSRKRSRLQFMEFLGDEVPEKRSTTTETEQNESIVPQIEIGESLFEIIKVTPLGSGPDFADSTNDTVDEHTVMKQEDPQDSVRGKEIQKSELSIVCGPSDDFSPIKVEEEVNSPSAESSFCVVCEEFVTCPTIVIPKDAVSLLQLHSLMSFSGCTSDHIKSVSASSAGLNMCQSHASLKKPSKKPIESPSTSTPLNVGQKHSPNHTSPSSVNNVPMNKNKQHPATESRRNRAISRLFSEPSPSPPPITSPSVSSTPSAFSSSNPFVKQQSSENVKTEGCGLLGLRKLMKYSTPQRDYSASDGCSLNENGNRQQLTYRPAPTSINFAKPVPTSTSSSTPNPNPGTIFAKRSTNEIIKTHRTPSLLDPKKGVESFLNLSTKKKMQFMEDKANGKISDIQSATPIFDLSIGWEGEEFLSGGSFVCIRCEDNCVGPTISVPKDPVKRKILWESVEEKQLHVFPMENMKPAALLCRWHAPGYLEELISRGLVERKVTETKEEEEDNTTIDGNSTTTGVISEDYFGHAQREVSDLSTFLSFPLKKVRRRNKDKSEK